MFLPVAGKFSTYDINCGTDIAVLQDRRSSLVKRPAVMASYEDGAAPAARVGADLRAARERVGWTLPAIAGHLRIRLPYLAALEDGRIADLPGVAYAVGFLRTYAAALGLDADEMSRRFRAEAAAANRRTELNFPAPVPERGVPAGAVVLIGALLAVAAYVGWYRMSETVHPLADAVQPVPAQLAPLAEKLTPPEPAAARMQAATTAPPPAAAPEPEPQPAQAAAAEPPPPPLPAFAPASAAAAVPPPPVAHIVVRATADSWIQVRDKGGQVLLSRVLRGGETWDVPDRPALLLTTGNAGGTELLVDGTATAALGNDGAVRRDLPLDADAIRDGKLAAAVRTPPAH